MTGAVAELRRPAKKMPSGWTVRLNDDPTVNVTLPINSSSASDVAPAGSTLSPTVMPFWASTVTPGERVSLPRGAVNVLATPKFLAAVTTSIDTAVALALIVRLLNVKATGEAMFDMT